MTSPLVTHDWLQQHLQDPNLRIIDCRFQLGDSQAGETAYQVGHIPSAQYLHLERDLSGPKQPNGAGGRHPLPNPAVFVTKLGSLGIDNQHHIVVYDDPSNGNGMFAARAWWLLRWLGHTNVSVLDGGFSAWNGPVSSEVPEFAQTTFEVQLHPEFLVDASEVEQLIQIPGSKVLIDSRAPERYRGDTEPLDKKAGHIPSALNLNWTDALKETGKFRNSVEQQERFQNLQDKKVVFYCGSGVSACVNLLALEVAGYKLGENTQLYAGSWSDWVSEPSRPTQNNV